MNQQAVVISVTDGVAYVDQVPPGVVVRVTDYDVDPQSPERDSQGRPCSVYEVTAPGRPIERRRPTRWER
ncbi:MAG: hypothetical protein ACKV22_09810 [Bryobacteraceae bacterium]